ncbi:hypothetical protein HFO56_33725 [Rhizobium laguerreae]|uniref:hypothetical protein n=1 Tax=Rhizobium laguerreae TaxID=1076926 RepID=UPI001C90CEBF|nr:hypothetical protein [Rhizobium laguerreae]MBY3157287.1 hypothetical protein [Rhizobium laguerreae]
MNIMEIDDVVYEVCREWHDSKAMPVMHAVAFRATGDRNFDVDLLILRTEIAQCIEECLIPEKAGVLALACEILDRRIEKDDVFWRIVELVGRAKSAGMEQDEFAVALAVAWEGAE